MEMVTGDEIIGGRLPTEDRMGRNLISSSRNSKRLIIIGAILLVITFFMGRYVGQHSQLEQTPNTPESIKVSSSPQDSLIVSSSSKDSEPPKTTQPLQIPDPLNTSESPKEPLSPKAKQPSRLPDPLNTPESPKELQSPKAKQPSRSPEGNASVSQAFTNIYDNKLWDPSGKHPSGTGSIPEENIQYLILYQYLVSHPEVKKIVEVGFGDYQLSRLIRIPQDKKYIGFDVVPSLLQPNTINREFRIVSSIYDMNEEGDLLVSKDVIQHWPNKEVNFFIKEVMPRFKYVLLTNDYNQGPRRDIKAGDFSFVDETMINPKELILDLPWMKKIQKKTYVIPKLP